MTHPTFEELIDAAKGAVDPHVAVHLDTCEACRAESRRWGVVAEGVRRYVPRSRRRRTVLAPVAAAVAIVLVAMTAYAVGAVLDRPVRVGAPTPTRCTSLHVAAGTLRGDAIRAADGREVPLDISASTDVARLRGGPRRAGDLTVGTPVVVSGERGPARLEARHVVVLPGPVDLPTRDLGRILEGSGILLGTVSDVDGSGLTVRGSDGRRVRVAMDRTTSVVTREEIAARDLEPGAHTVAVGTPGADGTLRAAAVQQRTPSGQGIVLALPASALGCDPAALATSTLLASGR